MSIATEVIYDVFLSHGVHDKGIADVVKRALAEEGFKVFAVDELKINGSAMAGIREALAECSAFVMILTRSTLESSNSAFEIGAAMAWNKPIFVLYDGLPKKEIPEYLKDFTVVQFTKLPQVVQEIANLQQQFSDDDRESLVQVYQNLGVPTDQLLIKPLALRDLSKKYDEVTHSTCAAERLVQELIRLRKQGKLPKIKRK